jgi:hypothetical protein
MKFSDKSAAQLATCAEPLQRLFEAVLADGHDCTIIEGHRTKEKQEEYFRTGKSKKKWPDGKHCSMPSQAVDVMPYPIDWSDRPRLEAFAKVVFAKAAELGIKVRWGGDWDQDGLSSDERFFDGPHWELMP